MRYHLGLAALATATTLTMTACGEDSNLADPDECAGAPEATVTDAGSEPQRAMELTPAVGDSVALDMEVAMVVDVEVDGDSVPTNPVPTIRLGMVTTVDAVSDDRIDMSFVYDGVSTDGGDPTIQDTLESMVGTSGTLSTTRNGVFLEGDIATEGLDTALASVAGQLEQQMADMTIPLPAEPVGQGAEWEVDSSLELNGIEYCNFYTYRLAEFDGESYELDMEMSQRPVGGTSYEGGATIEVVDGEATASGHSSGELSLPIAVSASTEASSTMEMKVEQGGSEVTQEVGVEAQMELAARE